jgi:hypothetical protein
LIDGIDPFLVVEKVALIPEGARVKRLHTFVAMTEQIQNNLNPVWRPLLLNAAACGGMDQQLRLSVYDYDSDGTHVWRERERERERLRYEWHRASFAVRLTVLLLP